MDALNLLKKDHRTLLKILDEISSTDSNDIQTRKELFQKAKSELITHEKIEEKYFYPKLKNDEESKPLTLEAYEEHSLANKILKELNKVDFDDDKWDAKFKVLKENIQHHIKEEEEELFKKAKEVFNKKQLNELGDKMQEAKEHIE